MTWFSSPADMGFRFGFSTSGSSGNSMSRPRLVILNTDPTLATPPRFCLLSRLTRSSTPQASLAVDKHGGAS